jgi:hypothetical protein
MLRDKNVSVLVQFPKLTYKPIKQTDTIDKMFAFQIGLDLYVREKKFWAFTSTFEITLRVIAHGQIYVNITGTIASVGK